MGFRLDANVQRSTPIVVRVNGLPVGAFAGETIATVLLAEDVTVFYRTANDQPRAPYCNMGVCFECQVCVKGPGHQLALRWVRACMTPIEEGLEIFTGLRQQVGLDHIA